MAQRSQGPRCSPPRNPGPPHTRTNPTEAPLAVEGEGPRVALKHGDAGGGGGGDGVGEVQARRAGAGRGGLASGEGLRGHVHPRVMWSSPPQRTQRVSFVHMAEMCPASPQLQQHPKSATDRRELGGTRHWQDLPLRQPGRRGTVGQVAGTAVSLCLPVRAAMGQRVVGACRAALDNRAEGRPQHLWNDDDGTERWSGRRGRSLRRKRTPRGRP